MEVCLTTTDPDFDPTTIIWDSNPTPISTTERQDELGGGAIYYATYSFETPGTYNFSATVYDMAYDADGNLVTIESLLELQGDPSSSNDTIDFPVYVLDPTACLTPGQ